MGEALQGLVILLVLFLYLLTTYTWTTLAVLGGCLAIAVVLRIFQKRAGGGTSSRRWSAEARSVSPRDRDGARAGRSPKSKASTPVLDATDLRAIRAMLGRKAMVRGVVQRVSHARSRKVSWIAFVSSYDGFEAVIFRRAMPAFERCFGDLGETLPGRPILIGGVISRYGHRLQVILNDTWQLALEESAALPPEVPGGSGKEVPSERARKSDRGEPPLDKGLAWETTSEEPDSGAEDEEASRRAAAKAEALADDAWAVLWHTIVFGSMAEIIRLFWWLPSKGVDPFPRDLAVGGAGIAVAFGVAGIIAWKTGRPVPTYK